MKFNRGLFNRWFLTQHRGGAFPVLERGGNIAHGAGNEAYGIPKYANCIEGLVAASKSFSAVELDVTSGQDALLVAHSGFEDRYGLTKPFKSVTELEFRQLQFDRRFETMTIRQASELAADLSLPLVLDIKPKGAAYRKAIRALQEQIGPDLSCQWVVPQAYTLDELHFVLKQGFAGVVVALWKYFDTDITNEQAVRLVRRVSELKGQGFVALSIRWRHVVRGGEVISPAEHPLLRQDPTIPVFVHAQKRDLEESLRAAGYGLYTH